jgi:hypothetical protein
VTWTSAVIVKVQLLKAHPEAKPETAVNRPGTCPRGAFATSRTIVPGVTWNVHGVVGRTQRPAFGMTATVPPAGPTMLMVSVKLGCACAGEGNVKCGI